jgi:glycosyltransferase involved in cell wall biosynthesis
METSLPEVSVILPILNEEQNLTNCISAILNQDYGGKIEVILALGPSKDKTNEIAKKLEATDSRVKLVENPSGQTAAGLNLAIAKSNYEIICRIDGHSEISKDYISRAIKIMQNTNAVNVGGVMHADSNQGLQRVIALAMRSKLGVGPSKFHTGGSAGESDTVYLGTFKKSALLKVGGFDERYIRAQDWELNYRLRKNGGLIWFDPQLIVTYRPRSSIIKLAKQYFQYGRWRRVVSRQYKETVNYRLRKNGGLIWFDPQLIVTYRPRSSIIKLAKQYFQYGRWRRVVSRQYKETVNYRYLAPPFTLVATTISIILSVIFNPIFIIPTLIYLILISIGSLIIGKSLFEKLLMPSVLLVMHLSWGLGFITSSKKLLKSS